ncbi:L-ascorbate metabolism protein UlaG, beta-lactamase superfamily [Roseivivax marinus]|uniref:MBL fold metallo-hydrolase n=1 Tax=Roseivivax marinus TaxID=1379903 RepID=UPI0008B184D2|nr:MBL fold metallo-hydrolase [Roseivivax marinus]SEK88755.1 L-ascorbate metabolism protein UlaG, beta-lactamase superfamily [Roseivivax marinus]
MIRTLVAACLGLVALAPLAGPAAAQSDAQPSHCIAIADAAPGIEYLHKASWQAPVPRYSVRLHYITHASFLIRTEEGLNAVTDFTGYIGNTTMIPDVVTMNHAHSSHWTAHPDPAIPHVLQGWGEDFGTGIDHHVRIGDMTVRNVSTDIRSGFGNREESGNSIFVFETAGLCIVHLGHLHHEPNEQQYAALGRADVLMVPVDGGYTMPRGNMIEVVERLKAPIVIPMHWFSTYALEDFLDGVSEIWAVERVGGPTLEVSLADLPDRRTVMVLEPGWLTDAAADEAPATPSD